MCNVRSINNSTKQENIVHWYLESNNMVFILTETKLKVNVEPWIKNKFEGIKIFTSGLNTGFLDAGVAIVISVYLLFKNKLLVTFLGLYAGALAKTQFSQAFGINFLISRAVNTSSFVVLSGNFNENKIKKYASFKKCLEVGLTNLLNGFSSSKFSTWSNLCEILKVIDYVFVSNILASAIVRCEVASIFKFFDTDHNMVEISVGLGGLVNAHLNNIHKQANKDQWKFKIKNADVTNLAMSLNSFLVAKEKKDLNRMWEVLKSAMCDSANKIFFKHWFSKFDCPKNKQSLGFFKLESLIAKVMKCLSTGLILEFDHLVWVWSTLDNIEASKFLVLCHDKPRSTVLEHLSRAKKDYCKSKYYKAKLAKNECIRDAINKNVLEQLFCKVVLDYLVIGDELVIEPGETHKWRVSPVLSALWACQYSPLEYVNDAAFSEVMCNISLDELFLVFSGLFDRKAAGFSGISNELWKHCSNEVITCLLDLLNSCLMMGDVLIPWKRAWPIALIKTTRKILSKVLSNHILFVYSKFGILHGDNFSVLRGTLTQSSVFAVDSVIKDALEKTYDSVSWHHLKLSLKHIKICSKFIKFFGNIHENRYNRIITNFSFLNGYVVYDDLNQGKVFSPLLWKKFYNPLLCEIKRQEHLCSYKINSNFVAKTGRIKASGSKSFFFVTGAFFFEINDISINNDKTVTIPINQRVVNVSLSISDRLISVTSKNESHRYLDIFLSMEGLFKPSLAKTHVDVRFFSNMVLKKAISNKQFLYLVLAVFQLIGLRAKTMLPRDFSNEALHYPSLYDLKSFEQIQAEAKVALVISFSNVSEILSCLFEHHALDLQVLEWVLFYSLSYLIKLRVCLLDNFLAGIMRILVDINVSLSNNIPNAFHCPGCVLMFEILESTSYFDVVHSLKHFSIAFSNVLLDKHDCFTRAFVHMSDYLLGPGGGVAVVDHSNILCLTDFLSVCKHLHKRNTSGNCKNSLREDPKQWVDFRAASSSTSTPQTPRTPSYIDKIKQCNWGDIPITGGYSSLFQNPLFQPKFRMGFENREEESESESEKETSEKTITRPVTRTSSQSRNQETHDQEKEPDIREATFRNAQGNIIPPPLRPINPPAENGNEMTTPYIARLTDFSGEEEETDVHTWLREAQKAIQANNWND
ncbi:hypothetical protein G9A89_006621 [Geosiphon pyriformis]|nr:hypothetical protein G9A89_006621 [Geosiphon pyriformis]